MEHRDSSTLGARVNALGSPESKAAVPNSVTTRQNGTAAQPDITFAILRMLQKQHRIAFHWRETLDSLPWHGERDMAPDWCYAEDGKNKYFVDYDHAKRLRELRGRPNLEEAVKAGKSVRPLKLTVRFQSSSNALASRRHSAHQFDLEAESYLGTLGPICDFLPLL
jgi:hypothetical protein